MAAPVSGRVYFIINKKSGFAYDLEPLAEDIDRGRVVVGLPLNRHNSQKWEFIERGPYWIIKNIANGKYKDLLTPPGVAPSAPVVTKNEREWHVVRDDQFDGYRFFIPDTQLNTGLIPNVAGTPVTLELRAPILDQVWELREAD